MSNVIDLKTRKPITQDFQDTEYLATVMTMDKLELLDEMIRFQQMGGLKNITIMAAVRASHLFEVLEATAETNELKEVCMTYRSRLKELLDSKREVKNG